MDVEISIEEENVGTNNSIKEEVKKDQGGASKEMLEDEMDSSNEEEIWRSRRERMNNALAAGRNAERLDPLEVYAATQRLVNAIRDADVEEFISVTERFANQTDPSAIFNLMSGWTGSVLHIATDAGKDDILRLLLDYVPRRLLAAQNERGDTPLHVAIMTKRSRASEMLIRRTRDLPNVEDKNQILRMKNIYGNTALHEAVLARNVDAVHLLVNEDLELVYLKSADQKSPLYLAVDSKDTAIHEILFSLPLEPSRIQGMLPIHGAVICKRSDLLKKILEKNAKLFALTDSRSGNVFHLAAYKRDSKVFELLRPETEYLARQPDMNGDLPIHIASKMGSFVLIKKLKNVSQVLNGRGQTVLHVAAKYGRASLVRRILKHPELGTQINAVDHAGNTALHLAAMHSQPAALIALLLDGRISLDVHNNKCLTAIDVAQECIAKQYTIRKQLTLLALACSCMGKAFPRRIDLLILRPEAQDEEAALVRPRERMPKWDSVKEFINSRMVVATLVATVTFAAGFAVPGGFNGSDTASKDDRGMATMLDKRMFQAFVICNTIAMFCSMTVVVNLIWARLHDVEVAITAYENTTLPLQIALPAMSTAFLTGVTLTVGKLPWLANTIFFMGLFFLLIISGAKLLEFPPFLNIRSRPALRLTFRVILAFISLWRVQTYIYDDAEDEGNGEQDHL